MGKITDKERWISLGPWGGGGGDDFIFKLDGPIMQITVWHGSSYGNGSAIYSMLFESKSSDDDVKGSSVKIGGSGGEVGKSDQFCIDSSVELISSIDLTYGIFKSKEVLTSLCFTTNLNQHGPYGDVYEEGGKSVSIPIQGAVIAGFHGRHGYYVDAIGVFMAPKIDRFLNSETSDVGNLHSIQDPNSTPTQLKGTISDQEGRISVGPWGGEDGESWICNGDGRIMQVTICYGLAINSILIESESCDGVVEGSSKEFGGTYSYKTVKFNIDNAEEELLCISLTYGYFFGKMTIISLCFKTNLKQYGPFGLGTGSYSMSIPIKDAVLRGFHGRAGPYIFAFGISLAPKVIISSQSGQEPDQAPTKPKVSRSGSRSKSKKFDQKFIQNGASSSNGTGASASATIYEVDVQRVDSASPSETIHNDLQPVDSAFQNNITSMDKQINEARQKLEMLQRPGSKQSDFEELGHDIGELKLQILCATNKDDPQVGAASPSEEPTPETVLETPTIKSKWSSRFSVPNVMIKTHYCCGFKPKTLDDHRGAKLKPQIPSGTNEDDQDLSPTSKLIRSDLILLGTALKEAVSVHNVKENIENAEKKFKELCERSHGSESEKKDLRTKIAKLKVEIRSQSKIPLGISQNWDDIKRAEDGTKKLFDKERVDQRIRKSDVLTAFNELSVPHRQCLLCFFEFPPEVSIKKTPMIYLWIGQGYISRPEDCDQRNWDVKSHADEIFNELTCKKQLIKPIYQKCSLEPDSYKMEHSVRSSLYEEAERGGFTSRGTIDLDAKSLRPSGKSCLVNVGEAIIRCKPEVFEKHIQSLYLGRWQSLAKHHVEVPDVNILHGLNKLKSLTFLSLQGISMITELPTFISELSNLMILDLRACHNLEMITKHIGKLKSLTHLDMSECYLLDHMPKSLAQLSNLQVLKGFLIEDFSNKKNPCTLFNLSGLEMLRKLNIYIRVKDTNRLDDLIYLDVFEGLEKLTISLGGCTLQGGAETIEGALQYATLPPNLQKLDLQCFPMISLPNCLMPSELKVLKKMYITGGKIRYLGQLGSLEWEPWKTVKVLKLKHLNELELDWSDLRVLFPEITSLHQVKCPKLRNFPCDEMGIWKIGEASDNHVQ